MKVHLIKKQSIEDYILKNAGSKTFFALWFMVLKNANWDKPSDIIQTYKSADILGNSSSRVVFNIGGNHYRLICKYHFGKKQVHLFIKWIGTHAEYTKLCKLGKQYEINLY